MNKYIATAGRVVAGAGTAAGAVLVGAALGFDPTDMFKGDEVENAAEAAKEGGFSIFADEAQIKAGEDVIGLNKMGAAIVGSGAVGAGLVGGKVFANHIEHHETMEKEAAVNNPVEGGFVEREQLRATQALMRARMQAMSPGYAQAGPAMS